MAVADYRFDGDTAVVTGSTRGIGAEIARHFGRLGASVVVTGPPDQVRAGRAVSRAVSGTDGDGTFVPADLRDEAEVESLVKGATSAYGDIDHVINNAAVVTTESPRDCTTAAWESLLAVNLRAYWLVVKHALAHLDRGTVTNVSSIHATATLPEAFPYNVSKTAVAGLTRSLAIDLGPDIRVNSVEPGQVVVERNESAVEAQSDEVSESYPLERLGDPEDVASVVAFLASDAAAFVTGVNLPVDGGLHSLQAAHREQA
jgi:NAD(P)-dependent dehydrogenase (short-subunit alcohol dehydrogenase family)